MLQNFMTVFARRPVTLAICTYWMAFWLLNGLDKFLARKSLGVMTWYGNDRVEKFGMYFDRLAFPEGAIVPTLLFAGIVEIALAGLFLYALRELVRQTPGAVRWADLAVAMSVICFLGFAIFDVVVGDRVELWEHTTYVGVLLISYLTMAAEVFFNHLQKETGAPAFQAAAEERGNPLLEPAE
ncbi:MAG: hypothetical protein AAFY73_02320 [Pseudomonadota bacterium]